MLQGFGMERHIMMPCWSRAIITGAIPASATGIGDTGEFEARAWRGLKLSGLGLLI